MLEQKFAEFSYSEHGVPDRQLLISKWATLAKTITNTVKYIRVVLNRCQEDRQWTSIHSKIKRKLRSMRNNWLKTKAEEIQLHAYTSNIHAFYYTNP